MRKFPTTQHEQVCAAVPKVDAPFWLERWRSVPCILCPRGRCKHARRYTRGCAHQLATWTSHCTWRWYSIASAGFHHIAPSSPRACQTTVILESHSPVKEGQEEYWSRSRFKEAQLAWFFGCRCGSWQKYADVFFPIPFFCIFASPLMKSEKSTTYHYVKRIIWALRAFIRCHSSREVSPAQFLPTTSLFSHVSVHYSSTSLILNDE